MTQDLECTVRVGFLAACGQADRSGRGRVMSMRLADSGVVELRPPREATKDEDHGPVFPQLGKKLADAQRHPDCEISYVFATCCGFAYAEDATLPVVLERLGLEGHRCVKVERKVDALCICSTAYIVQSSDGEVVIVCYRGTQALNPLSWITDARLRTPSIRIGFDDGLGSFRIHGGFHRNMRATKSEVMYYLWKALRGESITGDAEGEAQGEGERKPGPMKVLYITGHSLGGAMATLLAEELLTTDSYRDIACSLRAVYTFGQPIVGNPDFADAYDRNPDLGPKTLRYVYANDIVPQLPSRDIGEYKHCGRQITFHSASASIIDSGSPYEGKWEPDPVGSKQLPRIWPLVFSPVLFVAKQLNMPILRVLPAQPSIEDHGPMNYMCALTPPDVQSFAV
jgi:hypothetical protein